MEKRCMPSPSPISEPLDRLESSCDGLLRPEKRLPRILPAQLKIEVGDREGLGIEPGLDVRPAEGSGHGRARTLSNREGRDDGLTECIAEGVQIHAAASVSDPGLHRELLR